MRIAYLDVFAGISGDMTLGALVDAGVSIDAIRAELEKVPMGGWHIHATRASKSGISGTQVTVSAGESEQRSTPPVDNGPSEHQHNHGADHGHGHHEHADHDHHDHGHGEHSAGDHHGHGGHDHKHEHAHGRSCRELVDMIEASALDANVIEKATQILWRIADAEAKIHSSTREEVHFHELGGLDSVVDIVGAVVGFGLLGVDEVVCSPLPVSHGYVDCAHGRLPVPAPAAAELMKGVPTFAADVEGETVTPTGAALATGLADRFGPQPPMSVETIAYGCGSKEFPGVPNVLRLFVGQRSGPMPGIEGGQGVWADAVAERVRLIEANLDDMNPEFFGEVVTRVFEAGAADVWMAPIYMKKGRPATQLSALSAPDRAEEVARAIVRYSTTFGVRISDCERRCLPREKALAQTAYGPIGVKLGRLGDQVVTASPEYDDCLAAAGQHGVPVKEVYAAALTAAREQVK